jgi:hypothetical protein
MVQLFKLNLRTRWLSFGILHWLTNAEIGLISDISPRIKGVFCTPVLRWIDYRIEGAAFSACIAFVRAGKGAVFLAEQYFHTLRASFHIHHTAPAGFGRRLLFYFVKRPIGES